MLRVEHLFWISSVPIGIPICILGIIGNTISMAIWLQFIRKKIGSSSSSAIYFVALGAVDNGLLVFFLLTESIPRLAGKHMTDSYSYGVFYAYVGFPLYFFFIVASIWMLVGLTVNRFIMVRFPIKARHHFTAHRAYIAIFSIILFCFVINFPHFFNYEPFHNPNAGRQYRETEYSTRGSAKRYEFWVHCMFLVLVPWFSIAVLNAWIITTLMYNTKNLKSLDQDPDKVAEREKQDRQITRTLLCVTFAFLILLAWECINQCFFMLQFGRGSSAPHWKMVQETYAFAKLGVIINASINCLFYCFSGETFRKELRRFFLRNEESTTTRRSATPRETVAV